MAAIPRIAQLVVGPVRNWLHIGVRDGERLPCERWRIRAASSLRRKNSSAFKMDIGPPRYPLVCPRWVGCAVGTCSSENKKRSLVPIEIHAVPCYPSFGVPDDCDL